jgi:hypothetical protein
MAAMKLCFRFIGRLLFISLLLTSAILKIKTPSNEKELVKNGYETIRGLHPSIKYGLPPVNNH